MKNVNDNADDDSVTILDERSSPKNNKPFLQRQQEEVDLRSVNLLHDDDDDDSSNHVSDCPNPDDPRVEPMASTPSPYKNNSTQPLDRSTLTWQKRQPSAASIRSPATQTLHVLSQNMDDLRYDWTSPGEESPMAATAAPSATRTTWTTTPTFNMASHGTATTRMTNQISKSPPNSSSSPDSDHLDWMTLKDHWERHSIAIHEKTGKLGIVIMRATFEQTRDKKRREKKDSNHKQHRDNNDDEGNLTHHRHCQVVRVLKASLAEYYGVQEGDWICYNAALDAPNAPNASNHDTPSRLQLADYSTVQTWAQQRPFVAQVLRPKPMEDSTSTVSIQANQDGLSLVPNGTMEKTTSSTSVAVGDHDPPSLPLDDDNNHSHHNNDESPIGRSTNSDDLPTNGNPKNKKRSTSSTPFRFKAATTLLELSRKRSAVQPDTSTRTKQVLQATNNNHSTHHATTQQNGTTATTSTATVGRATTTPSTTTASTTKPSTTHPKRPPSQKKKQSTIISNGKNNNRVTTHPPKTTRNNPFCLYCNHKPGRTAAKPRKHHPWCHHNEFFNDSGASDLLQRIQQGRHEFHCQTCEMEYQTGKLRPKAKHNKACEINQARLKEERERREEEEERKEKARKRRRKLKAKKLRETEKQQKDCHASVSSHSKETMTSSSSSEEEDDDDNGNEESSIYRPAQRKRQRIQTISIATKTKRNGQQRPETNHARPPPKQALITPPPLLTGDPSGPDNGTKKKKNANESTAHSTTMQQIKSNWVSFPDNPWGPSGHVMGDVLLYGPTSGMGHYETILPSPRFAVHPFRFGSGYRMTHDIPSQDGLTLLLLVRDPLASRSWGFQVSRDEFGHACLVESVDALSPASAAVSTIHKGGNNYRTTSSHRTHSHAWIFHFVSYYRHLWECPMAITHRPQLDFV